VSTGLQAALEHGLHLVPGLEDFPPIDPLDDEPLEDHLVPPYARGVGEDPQERDTPPVVHVLQHGLEGGAIAGHFQADVEPDDPQFLARLFNALSLYVDRQGGSHLRSQAKAVVIDVCNHDPLRPAVSADGRGHDANGAGARDQHVFTHQVEGKG
jgi:hypothetical protein